HQIVARNWRTKYCEIDIVSKKGDTIYFPEVKHRKNATSGDGLAAITPKKLNQMKFAAKFYVHTNKIEGVNLRLLAVATTGDTPVVTNLVEID
ncbi:MAG TPA: YraN family protein, partial [Candidatus Saccharimonadaceae bacterium]|nr:YraN family protein [Candidatus Saccharimonadaceae bacterium]